MPRLIMLCSAACLSAWTLAAISLGLAQSSAAPATESLPSRGAGAILDLSRWKLTLPIADPTSGHAKEVRLSEEEGFSHPDFFHCGNDQRCVTFRAPCGGAVTKGSSYPRSELRELTPSGRPAAWDNTGKETHWLALRAAFLHLPEKKAEAVCAQIHNATDDVLMIRLERRHLLVERTGAPSITLTTNYELGTELQIRIEAAAGRIRVWYADRLALDWEKPVSGCYFKAGCYTQSNLARGDAAEAYGEVAIYELVVSDATSE